MARQRIESTALYEGSRSFEGHVIAFTICSKNFLACAQSLHDSLRAHHGAVRFYVALCDDAGELDVASFHFEMITLDQLGIPSLDEMRHRYNIVELNTAIKPFAFLYLFDRYPGEMITYLDPDILVVSRFDELLETFAQGANCVLMPHALQPAEFAEIDDHNFLRYGIYNLGFCALRDTPQVRRVASWWGRRLEKQCVMDVPNCLFVDQKWAELLPAYIDNTVILRHPGYNVAYWNLSQRRVRIDGTTWTVNGKPLRFFHFGGNKIEDPKIFSRHCTQFTVDTIGDAALLLDIYRAMVFEHGHEYFSRLPYAFSWDGTLGRNPHTPSAIAVERQAFGCETPYLPLLRSQTLEQFIEARETTAGVIDARLAAEAAALPSSFDVLRLPGYCVCCERETGFLVGGGRSPVQSLDDRMLPDWRERLHCVSCGLCNRVRASFHILLQEFKPREGQKIYITEQKTGAYELLKRRFPDLQGSDYIPGEYRSGEMVDGIRHEDIQDMSFADEEFDYILTFDVLAHVPDQDRALREFFRCLKRNGRLMITAPFRHDQYDHQVRAILRKDGELEHLMQPEYHGNSVDPEAGSLCLRHFGWRLLDDLRAIGYVQAEALSYWSASAGYLGEPQIIIVARKPP